MTDYLQAQCIGTITSGPSFQATGKKYTVVNDGNSSFKCIGPDASFSGIVTGDKMRCGGKFRLNDNGGPVVAIVDATANTPYSTTLVEESAGAETGTLIQGPPGAKGLVVTALAAYSHDANYKTFEMEHDTDPGEPKVKVRYVVPSYWGTAGNPSPVLNSTYDHNGPLGGYYLQKISDGYYFSPWTMGQLP